jgi:hypothetical protein
MLSKTRQYFPATAANFQKTAISRASINILYKNADILSSFKEK